MHYTVFLYFSSVFKSEFQSFCSMNEVKGQIQIKYTSNHVFSFWALQSYKISTPTLLGKTFPADREIRMTQQGEPGAGLPFKIQQQKWQHTFETQHSESRRKETRLLSWCAKCQCKLLTLLRRRKAVVSSSWRWRGSASVTYLFAAAIKDAAKLRSLITSYSADETLNTSPCYHACVCRHCGTAVQYKKINILKQGSCKKNYLFSGNRQKKKFAEHPKINIEEDYLFFSVSLHYGAMWHLDVSAHRCGPRILIFFFF